MSEKTKKGSSRRAKTAIAVIAAVVIVLAIVIGACNIWAAVVEDSLRRASPSDTNGAQAIRIPNKRPRSSIWARAITRYSSSPTSI